MPSLSEWLAAIPDPTAKLQQQSNYASSIYERAQKASADQAMQQAGGQYASGDLSAAAGTLARSGDIENAQKLQAQGQAANAAGMKYLSQALPVFQKIAQLHQAEGPQAQAAAVTAAFDHIAPEAKQLTGMPDQTLAAVRQSLASDPQGTLDRLQATLPIEWKGVGDSLFGLQGNNPNPVATLEGSKYMTQPVGNGRSQIVKVGGAASSPAQAPPGAATPQQPPPVQSGTDPFTGPADVGVAHQIESNNNPTAVNQQSGAAGIDQTMPDTLRQPGLGVQPAQTNPDGTVSPQEMQRVGDQYIGALGQRYGNNVVYQLAAQDWGLGNVDKWLKKGGHVEQLPLETRNYIIKYALAKLSGGQPPPARQQMAQASPQAQPQAQPQGGARVVSAAPPASPVWRDATPDEKAHGVWQVNTETGQKSRETVAQTAAASPVDAAVDYFIQSGGKFPPGMRNPATSLRILEGAKAVAAKSGQKLSDIIGFGAERQANAATLTQLTSLRGKIGTYISTFDKNLDSLRSVIPKGAAGSAPIINRWVQAGRKEIQGDPDVARLNTWMTAVRDEYARILSGATGGAGITDAARSEADGIISKIDSIPAMYATLDAMHAESRNRVDSLDSAISDLRGQLRSGQPAKAQATASRSQPQRQGASKYTPAQQSALKRYGLAP